MMKNVLLLVFALVILTGCRTDITENFNEKTQSQKKKYFIKKNELSNQSVLKKLDVLQNQSLNSNKTNSKNGDEDVLEGRIILDNRILVVEDDNQNKSYTFPVRNTNDSTSALENLVIVPDNSSFRAFILRYNVNKEEREKIIKGENVEGLFDKTGLIDVDYNKINFPATSNNNRGGGGTTTTTTYYYGCVAIHFTVFTANNQACSYCENWTNLWIDISDCPSEGEGGNNDLPPPGSPGVGGGGSGGGTAPIEEDDPSFNGEYESIVSSFRNQLSPTQYAWFISAENKYIGMDLAGIYNQYNTPQVFNFLVSLIDNVTNKPSNIVFLYQAKNYLNIRGVDAGTMEIVNILKNQINSNTITYNFSDWAFGFLIQNSNASSYFSQYPNDLNAIFFPNFNPSDADEAESANALVDIIVEYLKSTKNTPINMQMWNFAWDTLKPIWLKQMRYNSIAAVKTANWLIKKLGPYALTPDKLLLINNQIALIRSAASSTGLINTNPGTMTWNDVVTCWLLEAGSFPVNTTAGYGNLPTIGFSGNDYVIAGKPGVQMRYLMHHQQYMNGTINPKSVMGVRGQAINRIKQGDFTSFDDEWGFGLPEILSTAVLQDGLQFCLGSYLTTVHITPKGNNQYELTFIIKNQTGWSSGTRWLNDQDNNPNNDSVLNDKPRGDGIHLGGTIAETFGWKETHTIP